MEYPKAIYHPKDDKRYQIAASAGQEEQILEAWGVNSAPKIPLSMPPVAPKAVEPPKAKRGRKPKAVETK
ncbi:hypothetical protein ACFFP0_24560 [Rhizobium puerariae]|uniref:Uncharacterized protein n=1 Tax=Rhizobium puerariae TaxID=1585791 RepID=A0ABV6AN45_9HYPH